MTQRHTQLTKQNLRIYKSQRLTDTEDGGGMMTGEALTGVDNELFNPVSSLDRTMGGFDARLVYPAVLTADTSSLLGANMMVSKMPQAQNVSVLLVKGDYYGQQRASIMERIESYRTATTESRMTLLGKQRKGSRMVEVYQNQNAPLPVVGQVLALRLIIDGNEVFEFIRISRLTDELRTFEDDKGEFIRRVLSITTSQALERDFEGMENASRYQAKPPARVMQTQIADSAKYYGIKPLAQPILQGDVSVKLPSIDEQLVPVSTIETAVADDWAQGKVIWIETAPARQVFAGGRVGNQLFLDTPVLPSSIVLAGFTDDGLGSLKNGDTVLSVDYANGVISGLTGQWLGAITAIPAILTRNYAYSEYINIDDTNVGREWSPVLRPHPARGSVSVSYRSGKNWYELIDNGDFTLRDADNAVRGTISANGSCIISLPALPDSGSQIIISWVPREYYQTIDEQEAGNVIEPQQINTDLVLPSEPISNLKPNTVKLTWSGGAASDDGQGNLTGSCTGKVNYATGEIRPVGLNAGNVQLSASQYSAVANTRAISVKIAQGSRQLSLIAGALQKGSLQLALSITRTTATGYTPKQYTIAVADIGKTPETVTFYNKYKQSALNSDDFALVLTDDGNGGLLHGNQPVVGSVNYHTGEIVVDMSALLGTVKQPQYSPYQITKDASSAGIAFRYDTIADIYISSATATVSTITSADTRAITQSIATGLQTYDVLSGKAYPNAVMLNNWVFEINGKRTIERNGVLYQNWDVSKGTGDVVGSLNSAGKLILHSADLNQANVKVLQGVYLSGSYEISEFVGRTQIAPVKPQSFTVYADISAETTLMGKAQADENITGDITGNINSETGFFAIKTSQPIMPDALRYNAVSQSTVPLDSSIIGINATRLPLDGKVPIYRAGDLIVIHNSIEQDLGSAHSAGQTITLNRAKLDRLCVLDSKGVHVDAEKYDYDLDTASLTWRTPLDLSDYALPLKAVLTWEEENRIVETSITGVLKLQNPISRDFEQENTFISSAVIAGDLLVRATEPFSQKAWTNVWQNTRIGDELLAKVNAKDYPIELTADGSISERWLIKFTSSDQFELYGETLGLVAKSDTLTDLAPINPATNKPYFKLPALAFGGGWAVQNCIRFNTQGTPYPLWIVRAISPTTERKSQRDGWSICLRGDTIVTDDAV